MQFLNASKFSDKKMYFGCIGNVVILLKISVLFYRKSNRTIQSTYFRENLVVDSDVLIKVFVLKHKSLKLKICAVTAYCHYENEK